MFTRVLYTVAAASGVVVDAPEATLARAGVGVFTGALAWCGTQHCPAGDAPATAATGRPASLIAAVVAASGAIPAVTSPSTDRWPWVTTTGFVYDLV